MVGFESAEVTNFCQLPVLWHYPFLKPFFWTLAKLPLPYRPFFSAPWPEALNKLIRFSKEIMLLGVARKPHKESSGGAIAPAMKIYTSYPPGAAPRACPKRISAGSRAIR